MTVTSTLPATGKATETATRETILIVDDGKDNRDFIIEYVLQPNSYKYLTAANGQDGLQMALEYRPDLILLDLQMPRMDGIEVLKRLQAYEVDIPVILMTFHGSEEIAIEVYRLGVKDYVKKPYYPEEMLDAIERSLTLTRLRREKEALTQRLIQANDKLHRRVQELNTLYNIGKQVTSTIDLQALLPRIVEAAVQVTKAEEGALCLIENKRLICRARKLLNQPNAESAAFEIRDRVAGHVIKSRQAVAVAGTQLRSIYPDGGPVSVAYTPLIIDNQILGVLGVSNASKGSATFDKQDSALLSALGDYAAIAIENSRNYMLLHADKEHLRDTFERFVPRTVVQEALTGPNGPSLGGTRREISVLFADIRGYTSWSETQGPETIVETLNHYLSLAAGVIMGWEGTLDKFMGDAIMAVFNAPQDQPDHVYRAVDAALAVRRAVEEVNHQHGHQLSFGIGVHVGDAVVGYIGNTNAMNYTAIGDTVNLTKRLQENAGPGQILIDDEVVKRLGDRVVTRALGPLQVKGRKQTVQAYELLDLQ